MSIHPKFMTSQALLNGVEAELKRCLDLMGRIEEEILPLISHPIAPTLRAALQDIDLLSQCLDDIGRCVHGLSAVESAREVVDSDVILSKIRLQDMRLRLEGGSYDSRKLSEKEELFLAHQKGGANPISSQTLVQPAPPPPADNEPFLF
jgi:hypothetical protein